MERTAEGDVVDLTAMAGVPAGDNEAGAVRSSNVSKLKAKGNMCTNEEGEQATYVNRSLLE